MLETPASIAFAGVVSVAYVFVLALLRRGGRCRWATVAIVAAGMGAWLGLSAALAASGVLESDLEALPPLLVRFIVFPTVAFALVITYMPRTGPFLDRTPADWFVSLQAIRVPVELVLFALFTAGVIHERLTFAGWNFDIAAGIGGLAVGYLMHKRMAPRWLVPAFNVLGLSLLFTIVTLAILSAPTPLQQFTDEPVFRIPFQVPFVWLPGFVVPLALLGHLLSLRKWARERGAGPS